jgi:hypothetical protein
MNKVFLLLSLLIFLRAHLSHAQSEHTKVTKLEGLVKDHKDLPLAGIDIFVDSLKTGIRTNKKGEFKLRIPEVTKTISVFSKDYGMQRVLYSGQKEISFTFPGNKMQISDKELAERGYILDVQVFQNLGQKDFSSYSDIFQIIREKFSGVVVNGSTIYVRGHIGGDQTPLYVVDNNYVSTIDYINPDELKSIELLKGEDAALYGARGAPGVFIITLKK